MSKRPATASYRALRALLIAERERAGVGRLGRPQSWIAPRLRVNVVEFVALAKAIGFEPGAGGATGLRGRSGSAGR